MPRKPRQPCSHPGCPILTTGGRCATHNRVAEQARGTRQQRGYGPEHDELRVRLMQTAYGQPCARCGLRMLPGQMLNLDHTDDRVGYLGMSHAWCNASAAGKAAHR